MEQASISAIPLESSCRIPKLILTFSNIRSFPINLRSVFSHAASIQETLEQIPACITITAAKSQFSIYHGVARGRRGYHFFSESFSMTRVDHVAAIHSLFTA